MDEQIVVQWAVLCYNLCIEIMIFIIYGFSWHGTQRCSSICYSLVGCFWEEAK
jgi:hypothetical protein